MSTRSYLPAIDSEDWSRRLLVPLHRFIWRAVRLEPQASLGQDVLGRVLVPVEGDSTVRAVEGAVCIRACSRPTCRTLRTGSPCCHIEDGNTLPSRLVVNLPLEF